MERRGQGQQHQGGLSLPRREIQIPAADGTPLPANLYTPAAVGAAVPLVVAVHGGGWQVRNLGYYDHWGPWLAERGYAVLAVTHSLPRPGFSAYPHTVLDVCAALRHVREHAQQFGIDPARIALMGDSSGAHLASMAALAGMKPPFTPAVLRLGAEEQGAAVPNPVKAVIALYGVFDLAQQWRHDQLARPRDHITEKLLGVSLLDDRRPYFEASPLSHVSARNTATSFLLAWGAVDDTVDSAAQSGAFGEALRQAGHVVRTVTFAEAPHFWAGDPIDEAGSYPSLLAPHLLRFLKMRL